MAIDKKGPCVIPRRVFEAWHLPAVPVQADGDFLNGADLVRERQEHALTVSRQAQVHGEHVRINHISFYVIQGKIPLGVLQRPLRVDKTVPAVRPILNVPVIEVIIMQQRPSDKASLITPQFQPSGQPEAAGSDMEGVVIDSGLAVMGETLRLFHPRGIEDILPIAQYGGGDAVLRLIHA